MPSISCFYTHYNREPVNITFVKYDRYMKVMLNSKSVVLTFRQLVSYPELFQTYVISLLLTEDTSRIDYEIEHYRNVYGVSTMKYWKNFSLTTEYDLILLEKNFHRNPLNSAEPKRSTSFKKIKKFLREFYKYHDGGHIQNPMDLFNEFYSREIRDTENIIEYNKRIETMSIILNNYGRDIYTYINAYL